MRRILIAGCGYVGSALSLRLAGAGYEVLALRRSGIETPGARSIRADLLDVDSLRGLPAGIDAVVYAAAADATDDRSYRSAYVDGLRYLLAALDGQPLRRVLFASSTGVYGQDDGSWVDEASAAEPTHFSGRRLLEGEHLLRRARVSAAAVRFAGIYGPGRTRMIDTVRSGAATIPSGPPSWSNRIHRDDCAGVLQHLLELPEIEPLYCAVDHEPTETAELLRWIAMRLGAEPPHTADAPPGRYGRSSNKRVRNARLLASGYRFRYPTFREGYGELIAVRSPS